MKGFLEPRISELYPLTSSSGLQRSLGIIKRKTLSGLTLFSRLKFLGKHKVSLGDLLITIIRRRKHESV
jgi:hypothetical protein